MNILSVLPGFAMTAVILAVGFGAFGALLGGRNTAKTGPLVS